MSLDFSWIHDKSMDPFYFAANIHAGDSSVRREGWGSTTRIMLTDTSNAFNTLGAALL